MHMKARYLFIIAIIFALIAVVGLRFNNKKALVLAKQIRDKDALAVDVKNDLSKLQEFVTKHMNSTVKIELTSSYERAVEKAKVGDTDVNGDLYAQAQAACDRQGIGSVAQAQCVQEYLNARVSPGQNAGTTPPPERSAFTYAFAAPNWTPDIAGFSILGSLVFGLSAVVVYILNMFKTRQTWAYTSQSSYCLVNKNLSQRHQEY